MTDESFGKLKRLSASCQLVKAAGMGDLRVGNKYRPDILTVVSDFELQGLTGKHGIELHTRRDGKAWYGWRETATGWVFAIGGVGPPPSEWYYDGPTRPTASRRRPAAGQVP
jgi:hypothetical protein